jgi:hypothetical protein
MSDLIVFVVEIVGIGFVVRKRKHNRSSVHLTRAAFCLAGIGVGDLGSGQWRAEMGGSVEF